MATPDGWESAFVAMSVALGASAEEASTALDEGARGRVASLVQALSHPVRETRAKALASGLARIAIAIEKARLA
jgi:hypothetical protein